MPGAYDPSSASVPTTWRPLAPPVRRHVETFEPVGRPTPYAGEENERKWKQAVRDSVDAKRPFVPPEEGARLAVRIEFRLRLRRAADEPDPDNLLKSTFDAMEGVLGEVVLPNGKVQADDRRIDFLEVVKRQVREGEDWGASIEVYELDGADP